MILSSFQLGRAGITHKSGSGEAFSTSGSVYKPKISRGAAYMYLSHLNLRQKIRMSFDILVSVIAYTNLKANKDALSTL